MQEVQCMYDEFSCVESCFIFHSGSFADPYERPENHVGFVIDGQPVDEFGGPIVAPGSIAVDEYGRPLAVDEYGRPVPAEYLEEYMYMQRQQQQQQQQQRGRGGDPSGRSSRFGLM